MPEFDFNKGDIIFWCEEIFRIRKDYGNSGEVEYIDGEFVSNSFQYKFEGESAVLVMTAEEAKKLTTDEIYERYSTMVAEGKL